MAQHKVYSSIVHAIRDKKLRKPFGLNEFRSACSGLGVGTYNAFL